MLGSSDPDRELLDAAALCGHLLGEASVHGFLAEHRPRLFPDEMFADLFPSGRGRPSVPADVVATVMVLQALEGRHRSPSRPRGANRRLRYRGINRNRLWLGQRVAAVNLQRLVNLGLTHRPDRWAVA